MIWNYNNIQIFYSQIGKGEPLVMLPGWGADNTIYALLIPYLKKKFKLYMLDLPGWGRSAAPPEIWGSEEYSDMVSSFINDVIGEKKISILGHSFGGKVALLTITKNEKIQRAIIISASGIRLALSPNKSMKVRFYKLAKKILPQNMVEELQDKFGSDDYKNSKGIMRKILVKVVNEDIREKITNITIPVLLLWGESDTATPVKAGAIMHEKLKNSVFITIDNTGHFPFLDNPKLISDYILEFYKDVR